MLRRGAAFFLYFAAATPLRDHEAACSQWASNGECDRNPLFMKQSCAHSCCTLAPRNCPDEVMQQPSTELCTTWATSGACEREHHFMSTRCADHCCKCTPPLLDDDASEACSSECCAKSPSFCGERELAAPSEGQCRAWATQGACHVELAYMLSIEACRAICQAYVLGEANDGGAEATGGRAECVASADPDGCIGDFVYTEAGWERM